MGNMNIISEKVYGQYEYTNEVAKTSGNYVKNSLDDSTQSITGTCYSVDGNNTFYGSFNGRIENDKMNYTIYETKPEYKEIIESIIPEVENEI